MSLTWKRPQAIKRWFGTDAGGNVCAIVDQRVDGWRVHLTAIGCGQPGGEWPDGRWPSADDAMEAADRYVTAHLDAS